MEGAEGWRLTRKPSPNDGYVERKLGGTLHQNPKSHSQFSSVEIETSEVPEEQDELPELESGSDDGPIGDPWPDLSFDEIENEGCNSDRSRRDRPKWKKTPSIEKNHHLTVSAVQYGIEGGQHRIIDLSKICLPNSDVYPKAVRVRYYGSEENPINGLDPFTVFPKRDALQPILKRDALQPITLRTFKGPVDQEPKITHQKPEPVKLHWDIPELANTQIFEEGYYKFNELYGPAMQYFQFHNFYIGYFKKNLRTGFGMSFQRDDKKIEGIFMCNVPHGICVVSRKITKPIPAKNSYISLFEESIAFLKNKFTQESYQTIYEGNMEYGMRNGLGK